MNNLIHVTYRENALSIKKEGFVLRKTDYPPRFGYGVYFMTSEEYGYGNESMSRIYCSVDDKYILHLSHDEIRLMYPELEVEYQEGGVPELIDYVLSKGYKAVEVSYIDGTSEVVVYDTKIIKYDGFDIREK